MVGYGEVQRFRVQTDLQELGTGEHMRDRPDLRIAQLAHAWQCEQRRDRNPSIVIAHNHVQDPVGTQPLAIQLPLNVRADLLGKRLATNHPHCPAAAALHDELCARRESLIDLCIDGGTPACMHMLLCAHEIDQESAWGAGKGAATCQRGACEVP